MSSSINALQARKERYFARLQTILDLSKKATTKADAEDLIARCAKIEDFYKDYEDVSLTLMEAELKETKEEPKITEIKGRYSSTCQAYEDMHQTVVVTLSKCNKVLQQAVVQGNRTTAVKLPRIELKTFDGDITKWSIFYENFKALIHDNAGLSNVEKFHYLVASLSGSALSYANHLPITSANYLIVWKDLIAQFQNERTLGTVLFESILNQPPITNNSASALKLLVSALNDSVESLKALKLKDLDDFMLLHVCLKKLPIYLRKLFEGQYVKTDIPTYANLLEFLRQQAKIAELSGSSSKEDNFHRPHKSDHVKKVYVSSENCDSRKGKCPVCVGEHSIYSCPDFLKLSTDARNKQVMQLHLCFNCLQDSHTIRECPSTMSCKFCQKRHHSLIHFNPRVVTACEVSAEENTDNNDHQVVCASRSDEITNTTVLLGTAIIHVKDSDGKFQPVRALLDSAAMNSFIIKACANKLKLPTESRETFFSGIANKNSKSSELVRCQIKPKFAPKNILSTEAVIVPTITSRLPPVGVSQTVRDAWSKLELADAHYHEPKEIEMLVGNDLFPYIYSGKKIFGSDGFGCAMESIFGWVLNGKVATDTKPKSRVSFLTINDSSRLEQAITKLWQVEEPPERKLSNPDDELCESMFQSLHSRDSEGRYIVPIMTKLDNPVLNGSFSLAQNRLINIEKRLIKSPKLQTDYNAFMDEYQSLKHMSPFLPIGGAKYYIPHHCVIHKSLKLRVVFDGSMTTQNGVSLNSVLYAGPKLQNDIMEIIGRFRCHKIAFTTDICKMFRQILIRQEDRKYQHILWRDSENGVLQDFELNTVTYGTGSAPFLANRTLIQLAHDEGHDFPEAAMILLKNTYVDDIMTGADDIDEAHKIKSQLVSLLARGKFKLGKWACNKPEILQGLKENEVAIKVDFNDVDQASLEALGIKWFPRKDYFSYNHIEFDQKSTKRTILSHIAKIYDPMGWITPVVLVAKNIIQHLWILGLDWDASLPSDVEQAWKIFQTQLSLLCELKIPRYIFSKIREIIIVGFSDASQKGYGATVYIRVTSETSDYKSNLYMAKSKVAPTKTLSIPRLELCGAVVLSKLLSFTIKSLETTRAQISKVVALTDSTTVLSWLSTPPYQLKTYASNRVVSILENVPIENWAHVATEHNPADLASRGLNPSQIVNNTFWWNGPTWLCSEVEKWPISPRHKMENEDDENIKSELQKKAVLTAIETPPMNSVLEKIGSLNKLQRLTAWFIRYIRIRFKLNSSKIDVSKPLSVTDLQDALNVWIRTAQKESFENDIKNINRNEPASQKLLPLNPFIDPDSFLRVGGRLQHANLPYAARHPIILPGDHHLTKLIINHYHETYAHAGPRLLQSILSQKFWILSCRRAVRSQLRKCVRCFRCTPKSTTPLMGNLPTSRVTPARCFLRVGIDFGGPFLIKESKRRNAGFHKAYISLFVCMVTKAIHLELVSALSTDAFIAALDRFVSRRGLCQEIFSDCGTNFVGAKNYYNELYSHLLASQDELQRALSKREIKWNFNPPSAPNFGGLWEAGIKSTKFHLIRTIGEQKLNFEELYTVFAKIEAILNSRPLCSISSDTDDLEVLTPAHFLVGGPLLSLPEFNFTEEPINRLSRWQLVQQISQHFWARWSKEYLNTLNQRGKWLKESTAVKLNDVCVVQDDNVAPLKWRIGKIIKLHPGRDNVVRVVSIKIASNTLIRPVTKICLLPIS